MAGRVALKKGRASDHDGGPTPKTVEKGDEFGHGGHLYVECQYAAQKDAGCNAVSYVFEGDDLSVKERYSYGKEHGHGTQQIPPAGSARMR